MEFFLFLDLCSLGVQGFMNAAVWLTNPTFIFAVRAQLYKLRFLFRKCCSCCPNNERLRFLESPPLSSSSTAGPSPGTSTPLLSSSQSIPSFETVLRTDIISCLLYGIQDSATGKTIDCSRFNENKEFPELMDAGQSVHPEKNAGFHFLDYYPTVFASIRSVDGITPEKYLESLNVEKFIRQGNFKVSDARSGAFFCIPPDKQYIIKMINKSEAKFLKKIIPELASFYKMEKNTLIVKLYGFHGIILPQGYAVHIVVMSNVFHTGMKLDRVYDLKGSWVNRKSTKPHLGLDLDFARKIKFPDHIRVLFLGQISRDATFLSGLGIMDYSLILGLRVLKNKDSKGQNLTNDGSHCLWSNGVLAEDNSEMYFLGIIDFLQQFNLSKKIEFFFKTKLLCNDSKGLSAVPPHEYCTRFLTAMQEKLVEVEDSEDYGFVMFESGD